MIRAGKEPSEDLQRRLAAVCTACGLNLGKKINRLMQDRKQRVVVVTGNPPGWKYELPAAFISANGDGKGVRIQCAASNDDPLATIWSAPTVRNAYVTLEISEDALKRVLKQRQEIINRQADNSDVTRFDFEPFLWEAPGQDMMKVLSM